MTRLRNIREFSPFKDLLPIIRQHHERIDGSGYPDKLSGDDICIGARIIAVADSFDAMISNRAYRKGLGFENTMSEIERCNGTKYDPKVVDALKSIISYMGKEEFVKRFCMNTEE